MPGLEPESSTRLGLLLGGPFNDWVNIFKWVKITNFMDEYDQLIITGYSELVAFVGKKSYLFRYR